MPEIRRLAEEEVQRLLRRSGEATSNRERTKQQYDELLSSFKPGEFGEIILGAEDKRITVRNNANRSAERLGMKIDWLRGDDQRLRFRVLDPVQKLPKQRKNGKG